MNVQEEELLNQEITFNPDSKITKDIFMKKVTKTLTYG